MIYVLMYRCIYAVNVKRTTRVRTYICIYVATRNVGSFLELEGHLSYQDTFVWRKLYSYGVTVINRGSTILLPTSTVCTYGYYK